MGVGWPSCGGEFRSRRTEDSGLERENLAISSEPLSVSYFSQSSDWDALRNPMRFSESSLPLDRLWMFMRPGCSYKVPRRSTHSVTLRNSCRTSWPIAARLTRKCRRCVPKVSLQLSSFGESDKTGLVLVIMTRILTP
jgi:hypothetical protein